MDYKIFYIYTLFLFLGVHLSAQTKTEKKDSIGVYKKIKNYSHQKKFTKTLHKLIFRSSGKKSGNKTNTMPQDYTEFQGKPIRNIIIQTLDPFGFSVEDTTKQAKNWASDLGNRFHLKSKNYTIRNLLLFKKNDLLDTLQITESKRLMRSQKFIRSVKIDIEKFDVLNDSVDVKVRVLDSWSLIPEGSLSTSKVNFQLKERNFLGLGHQFNNRLTNRFEDGKTAYGFDYLIPSIKNTYINTNLSYHINLDDYYKKSITIEKDFISTLTRWAGGMYIDEQFRQDSLPDTDFVFKNQSIKYNTQDFWIGHAFNIFKNRNYGSRTTNLITSLRFINANYKEKPAQEYDPINFFTDEVFYMGRIGISSQEYVDDNYIFRDGIVEDVPIGFAASMTSGIQKKNNKSRTYLGTNTSLAKYTSRGYFNASLEFGTFFNQNKLEQAAISLELNYFTNLMNLSSTWKMRQFIKPQLLLGFNRLNSIADRLNLNTDMISVGYSRNEFRHRDQNGMPSFDTEVYGTQKAVLSLQTQLYSPWNLIGFRLNPFINITSGLMLKTIDPEYEKKIYSSFGIGFIIRNDYLVFNSFQLSFSYYPTIPGQGDNVFKTNSLETQNIGLNAINVGKPSTIWYQ